MPDAPEAKVRARAGAIGFSGEAADTPVGESLRRREGAAAARPRDLRGPASHHSRRADQPSRHRQPRRADRGDQRLSRRRDPGLARSLSDRGLRRPALAGRRRPGRRRSTATSTTTGGWCSTRPPRRQGARAEQRAKAASRGDARRAAGAAARRACAAAAPDRRCGGRRSRGSTREIARIDTALADAGLFARDPAKAAAAFQGRARMPRTRSRAPRTTGSPPARRLKRRCALDGHCAIGIAQLGA